MTNWAVVLLVGAKLMGQASMSTVVFRTKSEPFARAELLLPLIPMSGFPSLFNNGMSALISGLFPLLEMQIITSFFWIIPKSP